MFFLVDNQRGILSYQIRHLHCRAQGARTHNICWHLPFRMDSFVHGHFFYFRLSIDWCVQSNTNLDAVIKYVAYYNVLYSGQ